MGRNKNHKPNDEIRNSVKVLAMAGWTNEEIATNHEVSSRTIKRHYQKELSEGRDIANANVVAALYKNAMKGNVAAQIFWVKARLGWQEGALPETGQDFNINVRVTGKGERLKAEVFDDQD